MRTAVRLLFSLLIAAACLAQAPSAKWQVGTVMEVKAHAPVAGEDASAVQYDVTLKVGNTEYVVLYVPPDGTLKDIARYRLGVDGTVLVGAHTIKYNDLLGTTREVTILRSWTVAASTPEQAPERKQ